MLPNFQTTGFRTERGIVYFAGETTAVSATRDSGSKASKRGNTKTMFSGGVVYNDKDSTQALTATLMIKGGFLTYIVDREAVQIGTSLVWNERDYGVVLDDDEYMEVSIEETLVSGDKAYVFLHLKDIK